MAAEGVGVGVVGEVATEVAEVAVKAIQEEAVEAVVNNRKGVRVEPLPFQGSQNQLQRRPPCRQHKRRERQKYRLKSDVGFVQNK